MNMETIIIKGLEVWPEDLGKMTWQEAMDTTANLGSGWRIPTIQEFKEILYPNRDNLGFNRWFYWSSTEYNTTYAYAFLIIKDSSCYDTPCIKEKVYSVRAVRDFTSGVAIEYLLKDF